jgi:hypothetical protein
MLKIIESYRQELTTNGIVICTYKDLQGNEVDCIDTVHANEYPNFELIEVQENEEVI